LQARITFVVLPMIEPNKYFCNKLSGMRV